MPRAALLLILAVAMTACGSQTTSPESSEPAGSSEPPPSSDDGEGTGEPFTLVWGKEQDPTGRSPFKDGSIHAYEIFSLVYEPLVRPDENLDAAPGLAESWEQIDDTTWHFTLRDGVSFSDGTPLTAEDVAGSWDGYVAAERAGSLFPVVADVAAVDDLTVEITTVGPTHNLPNWLEGFWILPGTKIAAGDMNPDEDLLGTGPFLAGEHVDSVSWTFTRNPDYWGPAPIADTVEIKFIPDDASRLAAVRTGEVDFAMTANPDVRGIFEGDDSVGVAVQETTDMYYLVLNGVWEDSVFLDQRVRHAIALAIDRQQIIDVALGGIGQPTASTPVGFPDACDPSGVLGAAERDVDQATQLLEDAEATDLRFRITVAPAFGAIRGPQIAQVIQQNLSEIGVTADVAILDGGAWLEETFTNGTFDATVNWFTGGGTPTRVTGYHNTESAGFTAGFLPPDANELVAGALSAPAGDTEAVEAACDAINELASFIPLVTKPTTLVYRTDRIQPVLLPVEPIQMTFRDIGRWWPAS